MSRGRGPGRVVRTRPLSRRDLAFAMWLKGIAGWNQTEGDWKRMLRLEPEGCFLAAIDGRPAGTVVAVSFGSRVGWIGMLLVRPEERRRGVGTTLLRRAVEYLEGRVDTIRLDATPEGERLYRRFGFAGEYGIHRNEVRTAGIRIPGFSPNGVEPVREQDLGPVVELDRTFTGLCRGALLRELWSGPGPALHCRLRGELTGYIMARPGTEALQVGPWVAEDGGTAARLLYVLLSRVRDGAGAVFVDTPSVHSDARAILSGLGFSRQRSLLRMYRGSSFEGERLGGIFGISGPEKG